MRDYAGKKPRQYMIVGDTGGMGLSMSSDTFRQLKDRRKNRTNRMEKNPGILRFGSLSVKVGFILLYCDNCDNFEISSFTGKENYRGL